MSFEYTKQVIEQRIDFQKKIVLTNVWQCCLNCSAWNEEKDQCDKFEAKPPAYIIVNGCKDHDFDIPF